MSYKKKIDSYILLDKVRREKPLVHHITNWVTIYDCAGIVKALGASPVMAHAPEEAGQMAALSSALVLNIGTLTTELIDAMKLAAKSANQKGIPVILDPCGAGATPFRDQKSFELLKETRVDIIKGNYSEIARISGENIKTRGVDTGDVSRDMVEITRRLAKKRACTVVATGKNDIIAGDNVLYTVKNGHSMMSSVVGTGCMAASVIGAFAAVENDLPLACAAALACYGIAAQCAAKRCKGPASFKNALMDHLFRMDAAMVRRMQKISRA